MGNPTDQKIAELERAFPSHQVWVVPRVIGGPVWCARRWDWKPGDPVINADTPGHLREYLEEAAEQ